VRLAALALTLAALALAGAAGAFTPADPLAPKQWYLAYDRAFDFWTELPALAPVRVAVVDSGIDERHPDLAGRIVAARSFVGGDLTDREGHGTFVAGEIAAILGNGIGIAGIAFPAELVVAKVVGGDGTISPKIEADAIRWAADSGARVINLSIGGLRDPHSPERDTYSELEQKAIEYAHRKGALVVAAVGNSDEAPRSPWPFASYPAALPHVVGVGALRQDGGVPLFSNRDRIYVDIAAPGEDVISTLPAALTAKRAGCAEQGYSPCGPPTYSSGEGTSFATPQVAAAAALLFAMKPSLKPDQVATILERTAVDLTPGNGCASCLPGRDELSGWGRLDIAAALQAAAGAPPPADQYEGNDSAGDRAFTIWGRDRLLTATIDFWDDQIDVYRVKLARGQRLAATLRGPVRTDLSLLLWKPGTQQVEPPPPLALDPRVFRNRIVQSAGAGPNERIVYRAPAAGWYFVEVKAVAEGSGPYTLRLAKS
jgi:subtilisin family serine protease